MKSTPFKRAISMMQAIAAALGAGVAMRPFLETLPAYRSRGHGIGRTTGKKWGPPPSGKYTGVVNGRRECERRMRQIERGIIAVSA